MARKTRTVLDLSPPTPTAPENESSDNDSAAEQLLAESQKSSPAKRQQPPSNSAVLNANLLNAARQTATQSSPPTQSAHYQGATADMERKKGALKRPSSSTVDLAQRQNLARRGDPYGFPESPQKDSRGSPLEKLPNTVNKVPLKRTKKKAKKTQVDVKQDVAPKRSAVAVAPLEDVHENGNYLILSDEPVAASSPPPTIPTIETHTADTAEPYKRQSGRLAGGKAKIDGVDFKRAHERGRSKHKRKADDRQEEIERPPKSPRRGTRDVSQLFSADIPVKEGRVLRSITLSHPVVSIPSRKPSKPDLKARKKGEERAVSPVEEDEAPPQLGDDDLDDPDVEKNEQSGVRADTANAPAASSDARAFVKSISSRQTRSKAKSTSNSFADSVEPGRRTLRSHGELIERADQAVETDDHYINAAGRHHPQQSLGEAETEGQGTQGLAGADSDTEGQDPVDAESQEEQQADDDEEKGDDEQSTGGVDAIDRVFKFLEREPRSGKCQTGEGIDIARMCNTARKLLALPNVSLEDITATSNEIRAVLKNCDAKQSTKQLKAIKVDAYGYLFRHLARYLKVLHDGLEEKYGDVKESIIAMRIASPLISDVIAFKDEIASWKARLPTRYRNDNFVKGVDSEFIVPLRLVDEEYRAILSHLEADAKAKKTHEKLIRRRKDRLAKQEQREEDEALRKEKWEHWQNLHVWRMNCEPDVARRRRLFINKSLFDTLIEQAEERDANGEKFERVPVFKQRDSLPARRSSPTAEPEWSEEQLLALLDGLTTLVGPRVFLDIFNRYCGRDGALRKFTVLEITAKAASLRFELLERYRREGWEVDEWIKRIPVLP